jgi:cell wall-associated NlpC family hydrolase
MRVLVKAAVVAAVTVLAARMTQAPHTTAAESAAAAPAVTAIAYAEQQIGRPYLWGGKGPDAFDCSGLVMKAYSAAGITLPRTSQEQWADGVHVAASEVADGDLVFFAGADGTSTSPGHVGLVVDAATSTMVDAYGSGIPVRYDTYGLPGSAGGLSDPVGFTDPAEGTS